MERLSRHLSHIQNSEVVQNCKDVNEPHLVPKLFGGREAAKALKEQGVTEVYCLTGGHVSPIMVGCNQLGIRVIDVRDEVTTAFAADASSRIKGIPGVAIVTAGPGLTNTVTAVKNAQLAESPLILFGGATAQLLKGRGSLQDIDQMALMKPHVKWAVSVTKVKDMIPTIRKAFDIAQSGVPGPVFIETPLDVLWPEQEIMASSGLSDQSPNFEFNRAAMMGYVADKYQRWFFSRIFRDAWEDPEPLEKKVYYRTNFKPSSVLNVCGRLRTCKKPVLVLGSQCTLRVKLIERLVESLEFLGVPVYLSGMSRGLLGKNHPLQMRHKRSLALKNSDLVILCGVPADFRLDYGRHVPFKSYFVHVHLDKNLLSKNTDLRPREEAILGDPCSFLIKLADMMEEPGKKWDRWFSYLRKNQEKREADIQATADEMGKLERFVHPIRCCQALENCLDDDSFLIADGGDFVGTASYIVQPRRPLRWLDPGVFGTLGVGAGFAIAAKATNPDSEVWILYGDGAFGWSLCEFDTYVRMKLPVIAVIGNDACWSQMYRDQVRVLHDSVACNLEYTHYEKVAEGFGAAGILVETEEQLIPAFKKAKEIARGGTPVCINVLLTKSSFREGSISL